MSDPIAATSYRTVSVLFYTTGLLGAVLFIPTAVFTMVAGARPSEYFGDVGGGFIQNLSDGTYVLFAAMFGVISAVEILAARWLRTAPAKGVALGWVLLAPGFLLSIGFVLPIWLILDPVKAVLLITATRQGKLERPHSI